MQYLLALFLMPLYSLAPSGPAHAPSAGSDVLVEPGFLPSGILVRKGRSHTVRTYVTRHDQQVTWRDLRQIAVLIA